MKHERGSAASGPRRLSPWSCAGAVTVLVALSFAAPRPLGAQEETSEFSAEGFNVLRIEQEDKLTVPKELAEEVWLFLVDRFVKDTLALKSLDPAFKAYYHEELFTDTYYDTPTLQVLATQNGVRRRHRVNLTVPDHRKSGRELVQIKINNLTPGKELERGEYKFEVELSKGIKNAEDAHPLFGIVKPSHREELKQRLRALGLDPSKMRPILTVEDLRRRIYITRYGEPFMTISHDQAHSELMWARAEVVEIEPELNEIPFTEGGPEVKRYMEQIGAKVSAIIMEEFPQIKQDLTPKYNKMFSQFEAEIPLLRLLIRTKLDNAGMLLTVLLVGISALAGGVFVLARNMSQKRERAAVEYTT